MTISRSTRNLAAACLYALLGLAPAEAVAQSLELSLEDGRVAARQEALAGNFALARDFALALLAADENDRDALVVLAAVEPQLGRARDGRRAGARAFRLSQTPEDRYEAARLTALAAANEERYTLSQFWLRRAAIHAPDERAFAQNRADFRAIRGLNPWSVNLAASVSPSSNINGGAEGECLYIPGFTDVDGNPICGALSGDAQALSGVAATANLALGYTLSASDTHRTRATALAYIRAVALSDEAKATAPGSRNTDFGSQVLELGLTHDRAMGDGALNARALVGVSAFGGEVHTGYLRTNLGYSTLLSERTQITVAGQLQRNFDPSPWTPATQSHSLSTTLTHQTQTGNRVTGRLTYAGQSSDNLNERFESLTAQVSYAIAEPIGPVQLSVTAGAALSLYDDYTIILPVPGGREDRRVFGSVTAVFPGLDYAGFVPSATLGVQDTSSNVSRFDRNEVSFTLGLQSSF